jgi:pyruvate/2-oxoglutarate dehydrogenase complex dihydrolipoamide dehydrogenase (E3) component
MHYDLIVIGSGPAGEKGAAQAAYFGKKVALIEREPFPGGAAANTGTLPLKTLCETALPLWDSVESIRSADKFRKISKRGGEQRLAQVE